MSARVFVEWNDHGIQRDYFTLDYPPTDLAGWLKDDAGIGEVVTQIENDLRVYLEDRFEDGGVGWLIAEGGGADAAAEILKRMRAHMQALGVPGV